MDSYALLWFLKQTILGPGAFYFANTETNQKVHTDFRGLTGRCWYQRIGKGRLGRERWPGAQLQQLGLHSRLRILEASFLSDGEMGTKISLEPITVQTPWESEGSSCFVSVVREIPVAPAPGRRTDRQHGRPCYPPAAGVAPFWRVSGSLKTFSVSSWVTYWTSQYFYVIISSFFKVMFSEKIIFFICISVKYKITFYIFIRSLWIVFSLFLIPSFSFSWIDFKEIYFIGLFKEAALVIL